MDGLLLVPVVSLGWEMKGEQDVKKIQQPKILMKLRVGGLPK
jgi:hypothetical protein